MSIFSFIVGLPTLIMSLIVIVFVINIIYDFTVARVKDVVSYFRQ